VTDFEEKTTSENALPIRPGLNIPMSELHFRFSRSGGPGGQHANRSATRVELLFDVAHSPSLDDSQRATLTGKLSSHLDREGVLHLVSQSSRSQTRNREELVRRFRSLLASALVRRRKRRPTRRTRSSRERRLESKRQRSEVKRQRRPPEM
jgi:ribosome-associated protein